MASLEFLNMEELEDIINNAIAEYPAEAEKSLNKIGLELKKELEAIYPDSTIICDPLSLSVSCHIGPHALAIAACKKII